MFIVKKCVNISKVVAFLFVAMLLSACSTGTTVTSSYTPPASTLIITANPERDAGDVARERAIAARPEPRSFDYASIYAARVDDGVAIPAFNYNKMNPRYLRKHVRYFGPERAGTIVVDANRRQLYLVESKGMAMRYGIAVGKEGFGWTGGSKLQWKQKWPTWTPPKKKIERNPELKKYAEGMKGDASNPLGARAMYLYKNGRDTMYRIHGTTKPYSIGKAASSGCFRMINQDVIDLYARVSTGNLVQVRTTIATHLIEPEGR